MPVSPSRTEYLKASVFPRAVTEGAFGPDARFVSFTVEDGPGDTAGAQFASDIVFGTVTVQTNGTATEPPRRHPVVIKFKNANPVMSAMMNMHQKFYNEYLFYARLLPELARHAAHPAAALALFPRLLYSNATLDGADGEEQVIVIASISPAGYRMTDQRVFLDAQHVLLALRKLGALHGLSYAAKASPDGRRALLELTASLAETQWFDGYWYKSPRFLPGTGYRGVNALIDSAAGAKYATAGRLDRVRGMLDGGSETMAELLRPVEPLAVLCHGDFCRNNLLFRYDPATGQPADATMFDPAQARYASPAVDLSFFLFMNTTDADRTALWDDYVAAYLAGVADVQPPAGDGRPAPLTAADVDAEMRAHGLYGYAQCSFFLPAMVDTRPPDVERLTTCTDDERIELINESGGPEADRLLASIVRHMADRQYI